MTHSLLLHSGDAAQISHPWRSRDEDASYSHFEAYPAFHSDMILSPSPPPPEPIQPIEPHRTDRPSTNPQITSLKAIFPDFDDAVIASVLESTHNDHDRALDVLLGMNDPSFVPPNPPPVQSQDGFPSGPSVDVQRRSQEALDEQLARRLALEEQQAASRAWQPQGGVEGQGIYQPYQARRGFGGRNGWPGAGGGGQPQGGPPQPQGQLGQGGRDTMTEFQEGFSRIAESGKKTFSSLVSKVRAKMQEFDQGQGWSWSQNQQPGPGASSLSYTPPGPQQGPGQGSYAQPYPQRQGSQSWPDTHTASPPRSGVSRLATTDSTLSTSPHESPYYDPNARGYDLYDDEEEDIQLNDRRTASTAAAATQRPASQADDTVSSPPPSDAIDPPSYASPATPPPNTVASWTTTTNPPARALSPTIAAGAKATTPGAPGSVDFSKLGLLPKRPISLVRPQSPPATGAPRVATSHSERTTDSADYHEPEFVENPFEDQ